MEAPCLTSKSLLEEDNLTINEGDSQSYRVMKSNITRERRDMGKSFNLSDEAETLGSLSSDDPSMWRLSRVQFIGPMEEVIREIAELEMKESGLKEKLVIVTLQRRFGGALFLDKANSL
ncbi:hypothetical protein V6N11_019294 [Hibiscus sabdariffa]|uniref:Uncharacterized protein n=1 Tax=Hibiscus sabdariffa TaxID=183260 RepID=A0ABR2R263_9ROSI